MIDGEQSNKKADNIMLNNSFSKKKLNLVNDKIQLTKDTLKEVDSLYGTYQSMNKNINKCIDLLNQSVRGGDAQSILDAARIEMKEIYTGAINRLDEKTAEINKELKNLYTYRERLLTERKKERQKETKNKKEE